MKEWKTEGMIILVIILFSLTGYLLYKSFFLFLSLALIVYLSWHLYQLNRFCSIFITHSKVNGPVPPGLWGFLYRKLNDQQARWLQYRHNKRRIFSRFQQAFKHFPYAVLILDASGKIRWHNHACKKILNTSSIINHYFSQLIEHPVLDEYLQAGNFKSPFEITSPIDQASILSLQFIPLTSATLSDSGSLLKNDSEKENETLVIIQDITSTYHLDQTRKDFIANVTHELKTPLTVFSGFLEPMCEDLNELSQQMPQHWARYIELMHQQSIRMNDIVSELLLLSKLEMNDSTLSEQLINMPVLLQNILQDAELLSRESAHQISLKAQENLALKGEVNTIKTIINNLLVNAIKYTPQRSKITVSWYARSGRAYLAVQDSGEGIAARHLSRLTERFYRVESGRSRDQGGTGLGLSIVNHALLKHQGQLKISSEIGRGSTFTCIFPEDRVEYLPQ
ncbi:MAG: phosphate regulon sensor histidine kinase PhoR [Gammaproteobacteria bacterium]|nr:phosphate regulon sensor histidine kinase PhoR [Gammaproteobacteria bacterium]